MKKLLSIPGLAFLLLMPFFLCAQVKTERILQQGKRVVLHSVTNNEEAKQILDPVSGGVSFLVKSSNANLQSSLKANGIVVVARLANDIFLVSGNNLPTTDVLMKAGVESIGKAVPEARIDARLIDKNIPAWAEPGAGMITVLIQVADLKSSQVISELNAININAFHPWPSSKNILQATVSHDQLIKLSALPSVVFVQPAKAEDRILNERSRNMSGASAALAPLAFGGRELSGKNITIGIGDDTDPSLHPDLADRIINHTPGIVRNHGAHTTATAAGGGIINQLRKGFSHKANIVSQWFSGIWMNAATYVADYGMVVTNNSYGSISNDCNYNGTYDLASLALDQQAFDLPNLLHVFASGNDGELTCSPFTLRYGTVLNGYQSAKNVITVGRTDVSLQASTSSSSGPTKDGRLKPEIVALGEAINSATGQFSIGNAYWNSWGTSMASPAVAGAIGLLYERYKQLNGGNNPAGALIKNVLLNGANDIGTAGPDYRHGYGFLNVENSLQIIENKQYWQDAVANNATKSFTVNVPAGTHQLKVMLYWHDQPASPLAQKTLVNDLDISVTAPGGNTFKPLVLSYQPANTVINAATNGEDHLNNSEQVVITLPSAGSHTITIRGFDVAVNAPQAFTVSYNLLMSGIQLLSPAGGQTLHSNGEALHLSWQYYGSDNTPFLIEASYDDGASWQTIAGNVPATQRYATWSPAVNVSMKTKVRISTANGSIAATSPAFALLPVVQMVSIPVSEQCEGYFGLKWRKRTDVDGYQVLLKQGAEYKVVQQINDNADTSFYIKGLSRDSVYYATVRVIKNGITGINAYATERKPDNGGCAGNVSNNDLAVTQLVSASAGRVFTSTAFSNSTPVVVRIKNLDDAVSSTYTVYTSFNGQAFVPLNVTSLIGSLAASDINIGSYNLSAPGNYPFVVIVKSSQADANPSNDTLRFTLRQLPNPVINLATAFNDGFEDLPVVNVLRRDTGVGGVSRWDFSSAEAFGRLRSRLSSANPRSGAKAITLDVSKATPYVSNPVNHFTGTFNLSSVPASEEVRLDFYFKHHGTAQKSDANNKVWARGNDQQEWVEIYDLGNNQAPTSGIYKHSGSIELSDKLSAAGQTFSTSTQIRLGQYGLYAAADNNQFAGYSFDDLRLAVAVNDLQVLSIDAPPEISCGTGGNTVIKATVRNSMNYAINNAEISYTINNLTPVKQTINIAANSTVQVSFSQPAVFNQPGTYQLKVAVNAQGDNVTENNSIQKQIHVQPQINSYPYLQTFELGNGGWYSDGLKNSWAYGSPNSVLIKKAASGTKAWKTNLTGAYNNNELSYLYSPCFDLSTMTEPVLRFSMAYDLEDCSNFGVLCDAAWVEYSYDGTTWTKLGNANSGMNWYDYADKNVWNKKNQTWWHVAGASLPKQSGSVVLRFVMQSDDGVAREGVAIDDIHIYDNAFPIYSGPVNSPEVEQNVAGNAITNFTSGSKIIAALNPANNNLGTTSVKAWFNTGAIRFNNKQYFAQRNITVKPAIAPTSGNVALKIYFTDAEVNQLRSASGCATCTSLTDYTGLSIVQYTDVNKANEDGSLDNNTSGAYNYFPSNSISFVPYDSGYYAQINVNRFSEFWLTTSDPDFALPANWVRFDAAKLNDVSAYLTWTVSNEKGVRGYEVEVQRPGANGFINVGTIQAKNTGTASYNFTDESPAKNGVYLYRIKQTDGNGSVSYSETRLLQFGQQFITINTFPNPFTDRLTISILTPQNEALNYTVHDAKGAVVMQGKWNAMAGENNFSLNANRLTKGFYFIKLIGESGSYNLRVVKN